MSIVELSSGHVFAAGSVKAVLPLDAPRFGHARFTVVGVGFTVEIVTPFCKEGFDAVRDEPGGVPAAFERYEIQVRALHREAIDKLLS
jgi:hypothetical protein